MKSPLYWCWVIALIGCTMSIYYGEILMIEPCRLCWYQRMALFPLAFILGMGIYRADNIALFRYAFPFAVFGGIVALIQAVHIHFPQVQICGEECAQPIFSIFGWVSFADLSVLGFLFIGYFIWTRSNKIIR